MKTLFFLLLIIALRLNVYAQGCAYAGSNDCNTNLGEPSALAINVVNDICKVLNVKYINIYTGTLANACATLDITGQPIITYNSNFLNYLSSGNSWAPISVVAHEVGHHLNADISWYGAFKHPWSKELRADYVSGYVLFKLGASLQNSQSAFQRMFSYFGTESHPDTPTRMQALAAGYNRAAAGY